MTPLQSEIEQRGKRIFELVDKYPESLFSKAGFYQRLMTLSMRDEQLKLQLFRFVAVLPSLHTSDEIIELLQEYFADGHKARRVAEFLGAVIRLAGIVAWISGPILRWNVSEMARQFIAGRNPNDVMSTLRKRRTQNIGFTVDLLGEAVVSETEADEYAARYLDLLEGLAHETKNWTDALEKNSELFPVVNLSVKISALYSQISPDDPAETIAHLAPKLRPLLRRARELGAFINFDMESYAHKNGTLELFKTVFMEEEFRDWPHAGIVIQAYLRDSDADLRHLIEWGRARGTRFAVRLVKGAYWDYETTKSRQNGWDCPVYLEKPESDANFETLTRLLLENESIVTSAFGSHNVRSIAHAQALAEQLGIDRSRFEFQLLYGMAGPIKRALVEMGYRVREYCPVGELLPGMSYLVRRLLENTSNEGFLRAKFSENATAEELLRDPREILRRSRNGVLQPPNATINMTTTTPKTQLGAHYENAPLTNFASPENQEKMRAALREQRNQFGRKVPLTINGEKIWTDKMFSSVNPSQPDQIVGYAAEAGIPEAERAVAAARAGFEKWRRTSFEERCQLLERAAEILERRRFELSALEVFEVGKPWAEADGDIREAIDFCTFYARQMRLIGRPRLTQNVPGEESYQHYWPRGVALVIAPWNFPMAILCGMVSAALVTGNTVIMKPSEQSVIIGAMLMEIYEEASVRVGNPEEPGIMVGQVIDEAAYRRILDYIEVGKNEATLAYQATDLPPHGYFIPPTIFTGLKPNMQIACEEIFGPVLGVIKVRDLDEAIEVANGTDYALTGGFFSRSPANIERIKAQLEAGNVYINRPCTGAIVGRHPFGGFKMSGGGTKAGGEDYLLNFLIPRVVTENVTRHGLAPEKTPEYREEFLWPKK